MAVVQQTKPKRTELKAGEVLCDYCTAKCCRYFALPIEMPKSRKDFDFVRWYLLHERASVFTEDETWYLLVHTRCRHLQDDYRCAIYDRRPHICREYSVDNCEYEDDWVYERYFETPEQVEEYADAVLPRRPGQSLRSPRPPLFPVVG